MHWRRTDPVQAVGAMMAIGPEAVDRLVRGMAGKSPLLRGLPVEHGAGWAVVFAAMIEGEAVLPRLEGAIALHEAASGWWLPVGCALDAPEHALASLWRSLRDADGVEPPAVIVPRFLPEAVRSDAADVYLLRGRTPFPESTLALRTEAAAAR